MDLLCDNWFSNKTTMVWTVRCRSRLELNGAAEEDDEEDAEEDTEEDAEENAEEDAEEDAEKEEKDSTGCCCC